LSPVVVQTNDGAGNLSTLNNITSISINGFNTCFLLTNKTVHCTGNALYGGIGDAQTAADRTTAWATKPAVGVTTAIAIAGGYRHTCALLDNGTVGNTTDDTIKCWGYDGNGEQGRGSITNARSTPVTVLTAAATPLTGVTSIAAGYNHSCAIASGTVYCWGSNNFGQLSETTATTQRLYATAIPSITNASSVYAGNGNTCVLKTDGSVTCFGYNTSGQLGDGSLISRYTPYDNVGGFLSANGNGVVHIALGIYNSCFVLSTGSVYCTGSDGIGMLGNGIYGSYSTTPVLIPGITSATGVTAPSVATCALLSDQTVKCWGEDSSGETGQGFADPSSPNTVLNFP
jgi:alpha-tubulin suppressor-like RCC1 family protein